MSGVLAKRDWKSFTDLVCQNDTVRRVTPVERLKLQGIPENWFENTNLTISQMFSCNGMSVNVVQHIAKLIRLFDVRQNAPENCHFFADGYYRRFSEESPTGLYMVLQTGETLPTYFSYRWLTHASDYVLIAEHETKKLKTGSWDF